MKELLDNHFTYHTPTPEKVVKYTEIRDLAKLFAEMIVAHVPAGLEQTQAVINVEQTVMWANAGIARNK